MVPRLFLTFATLLVLLPTFGRADPPPFAGSLKLGNILPLLDADSPGALAGCLRAVLLQSLPNPLYEASPGWGRTKMVNAVHWKDHGLRTHPETVKVAKNDGTWRKVRLTADNLADTLVFDLRNVEHPEPLHLSFAVFLSFDVHVELEQQQWESGVRLYGSSLRANARVKLALECDAEARLEPGESYLPDAIFRLRVVRAELHYDNLVVEHVAGVGGSAARLLGQMFHRSLDKLDPALERELLARADAAIVRAGDTREVRISLSRLLKKTEKTSGGR